MAGNVVVETSSDGGTTFDNSATIAPGSTVSFTVEDANTSTAVAGADFSFVDGTVTLDSTTVFSPNGLVIPFNFASVDDGLIEGTETVNLQVVNITSTAGLSTSGPVNSQVQSVNGTITITDNDTAVWTLTQTSAQNTDGVDEGASAVYTLTLDGTDGATTTGGVTANGAVQSGETATINLNRTFSDTLAGDFGETLDCLLYTSPSPRD